MGIMKWIGRQFGGVPVAGGMPVPAAPPTIPSGPVPQTPQQWQSVIGSVLGPPRPPQPTRDQIWSDIWVQPYRGPIEMDPWSLETPAMRALFRTQYRTSPVARAALRGKANDICVLEPTVLPADRDDPVSNMAAEFVKWTVETAPRGWHGLIDSIYTPGSIDGFSLCEKTLKVVTWKGRTAWGLDQVRNLDTGWLRLELDQFRNVLAVVNMIRGLEYYSPDQVILYSHNPQYSNPFGQSDMRAATRAASLIEDAYKLWYIVIQLTGEPYMVGKANQVRQEVMAAALENLRAGGYTVTHPEDSIEVLQLANATAAGTLKDFLQTQREDIFFAIRGVAQPFMEGDGGSDAHTDTAVQQGTSDAGERFAALEVAGVINTQLIPWLVGPNFTELRDDPSRMPRVKLGGTDWGQIKTILDVVKGAQETGVEVSAEWVHSATGIAPPRDEHDKLTPQGQGQPGDGGGQPPPKAHPHEAAPQQPAGKHLEEVKPGLHRWVKNHAAESEDAEEPTPITPETLAPSQFSDAVRFVPTTRITADPERFQFRRGHDEDDGTVRDLPPGKFDAGKCKPLSLWVDPEDEREYVVDGHHRLAWAERDGVARVPAKYLKAKTAEEAKAIGERINREQAPPHPATFSATHDPGLDAAMVARAVDALIAEFTGAA